VHIDLTMKASRIQIDSITGKRSTKETMATLEFDHSKFLDPFNFQSHQASSAAFLLKGLVSLSESEYLSACPVCASLSAMLQTNPNTSSFLTYNAKPERLSARTL
jgi:hypothetical protein